MIKFASRSSAVLYNFLVSNSRQGIFLIPANVCPVVPLTLKKANQPFCFIDIDSTHGMDKALCMEKVNQLAHVAGVLYVSPYGKVVDNVDFYDQIKEKRPGTLIIEDNCLCQIDTNCFTPSYQSSVDLALFSTGYSKYVDVGYGGWGIINDSLQYHLSPISFESNDLKLLQSEIKNSFASKIKLRYEGYHWLDNSELEELDAYQNEVLAQIDIISKHKAEINDIYNCLIPSSLKWEVGYQDWRYMLTIKSHRDILIQRIFDAGLFVGTNYPSVTKLFSDQICPCAEKEDSEVLNLFNDLRVDKCFAQKLCLVINTWYKEYEEDFL